MGLKRKAFIDGQARLDGWIETWLAKARVSPPTRQGEFFMRSTETPSAPPATLVSPGQTKDPPVCQDKFDESGSAGGTASGANSGLQSDDGPHQDQEVSPGTSAFCTRMEVCLPDLCYIMTLDGKCQRLYHGALRFSPTMKCMLCCLACLLLDCALFTSALRMSGTAMPPKGLVNQCRIEVG